MQERLIAIGVDGCRAGWVAVLLYEADSGRTRSQLRLFRTDQGGFQALVSECERLPHRPVVAVDVPIGLPKAANLRGCDREARRELGPRWMCVFPPVDRELFGHSFEEARDIVRRRRCLDPQGDHPIMTKQSIAIMPKIEEVDLVMRADPARQDWIVEVHPELCFVALSRACSPSRSALVLPPKKRSAGRGQREHLLANVFPDISEQLVAATWRRSEVGLDDTVDAFAALWSARRYLRDPRAAVQLGGELDEFGLRQRMFA